MLASPKELINGLRAREGDAEAAHAEEDRLLWRVLELLDRGNVNDASNLAAELLDYRNTSPDRVRWCA
jgi:hypothetical protein